MKRVSYCLRLWRAYLRVGFLTMTQYPADTVILLISMLVREASGFVGILAIVGVTGGMGNWNVYEVCILFSMCAVIEAIGQAFFDNVWGMDHMMRRGELDVFLTRPAPVFLQVLGGHPFSGGFIPDHLCGDLCVGGSAAKSSYWSVRGADPGGICDLWNHGKLRHLCHL